MGKARCYFFLFFHIFFWASSGLFFRCSHSEKKTLSSRAPLESGCCSPHVPLCSGMSGGAPLLSRGSERDRKMGSPLLTPGASCAILALFSVWGLQQPTRASDAATGGTCLQQGVRACNRGYVPAIAGTCLQQEVRACNRRHVPATWGTCL